MFLNKYQITDKIPRWLLYLVAIFFVAIIIVVIGILIFEKKYQDKIYPGIYIGKINFGGQTVEQAEELINQQINLIHQNDINFEYSGREISLMTTISSFEGGLSREIISFDSKKTIGQAINFGRGTNFFFNLANKITALIFKIPATLAYSIEEEEIKKILEENYNEFETPGQDAKLNINFGLPGGEDIMALSVMPEKIGKIIDYNKAIGELKNNLSNLKTDTIKLYSQTAYPKIYKNECLNIEVKVRQFLAITPFTLQYEEKTWLIDKQELANWLTLKKDDTNQVLIGLDNNQVTKFLDEEIAPQINQEPIEAKFQIKNDRVDEFRASQDGIEINNDKSIAAINAWLAANNETGINKKPINLIVAITKSNNNTANTNDLGINEIIGTGYSNFAGSPANRRHNIRIGGNAISGLLIKPGEEFSLVKALGDINAATGYLPELVIKGNETVPEYGGGLCQIGTTLFRTAIASGLPITARRNHSYRVSYYEPAGTDATIYNPRPDFRFINDTAHHILIQVRIEGNNLYFDMWGTNDGRIIEKTDPVIYNITSPGPTKIIETLDLEPGKKKCTERAHNGADAYFDYKVSYPAGIASTSPITKEVRFSSHYIPWQEVCLLGVEELSKTEEEDIDEINKTNEENNNIEQ